MGIRVSDDWKNMENTGKQPPNPGCGGGESVQSCTKIINVYFGNAYSWKRYTKVCKSSYDMMVLYLYNFDNTEENVQVGI